MARRYGEAFANAGEEAVSSAEQRGGQQPGDRSHPCVDASYVCGSVGHCSPLDERLTVFNPQQGFDILQVVLLAQGESERRVARNEEQVATPLMREDEAHGAMAEAAISVKDQHGRRHGG